MTNAELRALLSRTLPVGEAVSLVGATFHEPLDLSGVSIAPVDFTGATFNAAVDFSRAHFRGLAWFKPCRFRATASFDSASFGNDARFDHAVFDGAASFARATFEGTATFDGVVAERAMHLGGITALGNVSCASARFRGAFSLRDAECLGGLWLERTRFDERPDLSGCDVHGRTWLRGATIAGQGDAPTRMAASLTAYGYQWT
jgi:uncharacterized protein YjbI with pentapeptide repeats